MLDPSAANGFAQNRLDRRSEARADPAVLARALADPRARIVLFAGDEVLLGKGDGLHPLAALVPLGGDLGAALLLGWEADETPVFAAEIPPELPAGAGDRRDLRSIAAEGLVDAGLMGALAQGRSMLGWHRRHRFCANCGAPTAIALGGYRRDCAACGSEHFPRVDPVSIMLVSDGARALLGRQARFKPGSYSCLAGFIEPGETIEDAVRRETFEEAGIRVGRVRYHASQPWPFLSSLMIGCLAEAVTTAIVMDTAELEDCRWFPRAEVAAMVAGTHPDGLVCPPPMAIARRLIDHWLEEG